MTQQLALDIGPVAAPSLANFVAGANGEAVAALVALAESRSREKSIHLWGESGCGKTHLLSAVGRAPEARYIDCIETRGARAYAFERGCRLYAIDNVERAEHEDQVALFNLFNEVRGTRGAALVSSSHAAPVHLDLREDLRTRLGWGLVFQLAPLNDLDTEAALVRHAATRGLALPPEVGRYLITRFARDVASLVAVVDALDRFALERQRGLTLPLVREWLHDQENPLHVP